MIFGFTLSSQIQHSELLNFYTSDFGYALCLAKSLIQPNLSRFAIVFIKFVSFMFKNIIKLNYTGQ